MDRVAGRIAVPVVARHSLRVAALDQLLDIGRQDPGEAHVPVPVLDLVPVMVLHVLDAPLDLAGPTLRAVPFDSRREDEPLAPADQDVHVADRHLVQIGVVIAEESITMAYVTPD